MTLVAPSWLLRTTRLNAPNVQLRVASRFAAGDATTPAVNRSQVTRWESGQTAPTWDLVRRYEHLCGVAPGRLVAAVDLVHRDAAPRGATPQLRRPRPDDPAADAEPLLEAAVDGAALTGADWDTLSMLLGELPDVVMPRSLWRTLLERGLNEMAASVGLAYVHRAEAMARLCGHRRANPAVHALVGDVLSDPTAQVYSEAASLLQFYNHPGTGDMLRGVVADPVSTNALRAALFATASLLRDRRIAPESATDLIRMAHDYCRDDRHPYRVRRSAADVLLALTPKARERIATQLRTRPTDLVVASIVAGDGPMPTQQLRAVRRRVLAHVADTLGGTSHTDPTIRSLLESLTTDTNDDRRSHALHLLMVLPIGSAFGAAFVSELHDAVTTRQLDRVHEALGILMCLAPGNDLDLLTDIAVRAPGTQHLQDDAAVEACWAVGNAESVPAEDRLAERVLASVRDALTGDRPASPELLEAWAYVLGRRGLLDNPSLTATGRAGDSRVDPSAAQRWQSAIGWWSGLPAHVSAAAHESS